MMQNFDYYRLLRLALECPIDFYPSFTSREWIKINKWAARHSLLGVIFCGIKKLPEEKRPAKEIFLQWSLQYEAICGSNKSINCAAAKLTELFAQQGHSSLILKGPANALLYPDPMSRQTGDIDIWLSGGQERIQKTLLRLDLQDDMSVSPIHVRLRQRLFGSDVEIHYLATISFSPFKNKVLQFFLEAEIKKSVFCSYGFYVPTSKFALVMQLSHIKQHLFSSGLGLRQLVDFHQVLKSTSDDDRKVVNSLLTTFGLEHVASSVMWALREIFGMDEKYMLCAPCEKRGKFLLNVVLTGGNFGWYAEDYKQSVFTRWVKDRIRFLRLLSFDMSESIWREIHYWGRTLRLVPRRIRNKRIALGRR